MEGTHEAAGDGASAQVLRELERLPNRIAAALGTALQTQHRLIVADIRAALSDAIGTVNSRGRAPSDDQTPTEG